MNEIEKISFSERLLLLRRKKGLSQRTIAKTLNISPTNIMHYEKGEHAPSADVIINLASFLGVSIDFLLTGKNFFNDDDLFEKFKLIDVLPDSQRDTVKAMLNGVLLTTKSSSGISS